MIPAAAAFFLRKRSIFSRAKFRTDFTKGVLDPRINFSRTSNATITNSAGQIAYAPHNLLSASEQFDNAAWVGAGTKPTITANSIIAPNGTITADTLFFSVSGTGNRIQQGVSGLLVQGSTISIHMKGNVGGEVIRLWTGWDYKDCTLTTEWVRYSWTSPRVGSETLTFMLAALSGTPTIYVWGAQAEIGTTATTYNSTTVKNLLGYSELFDNAAWTKSNSFVQTNLLTYSEAFDNAVWNTVGSIAANTTISPNGYQTADTLTANTVYQTVTCTASTTYTFSFYAKLGTMLANKYLFAIRNDTAGTFIAQDISPSITLTSTDWQRVTYTFTTPIGCTTVRPYVYRDSAVGANGTVYIWGAQLVQGSDAGDYRRTDAAALPVYYANHNGVVCAEQIHASAVNGTFLESYTPAGGSQTFSIWMRRVTGTGNVDLTMDSGATYTTQTISSTWARYSVTSSPTAGAKTAGVRIVTSGDVIQAFGAMVSDSASLDAYSLNIAAAPSAAAYYGPRFDYDPVTLQPKGLLIEEQRTNLLLNSVFANGGGAAPTSWSQVIATGTSAPVTSTKSSIGVAYSQSATAQRPFFGQSVTLAATTVYTLSMIVESASGLTVGQIIAINGIAASSYRLNGATVLSSTTVAVGKLEATFTTTAGGATEMRMGIGVSGNATGTLIFSCPQVEAGAFATSFIPTAGSQVTRTADVATIVGSNFYSWYNQNDGTLYSRFDTPAIGNRNVVAVDDGTANNHIKIRTEGTDPYVREMYVTTEMVALDLGTVAAGTVYKASAGYKINDVAAVINSGTVGTDTTVTIPILNTLRIGTDQAGAYLNGHVYQVSAYNTRLPNSTLQAITA